MIPVLEHASPGATPSSITAQRPRPLSLQRPAPRRPLPRVTRALSGDEAFAVLAGLDLSEHSLDAIVDQVAHLAPTTATRCAAPWTLHEVAAGVVSAAQRTTTEGER